jgi:integrase
MASIATDSGGRRRILFVAKDGKRKTLYLGKTPVKAASAIKFRVEQLNSAQIAGHAVDDDIARWLANVGDDLNGKLAAVGLVAPRESSLLAAFLDGYIASRADVKGSTATVYGHTRRCLVEFFDAGKALREINAGDADRWRLWLINDQKLADNTVRRRFGIAKQFFRVALRQKLVNENPFADLVAAVKANTSRFYFVSREEAQKVLDACPNAQWRLMFALARFGGLRVPSEPLGLRWADIDWERGRMLVPSPKTEHHDGGESRLVPIFPELRPYLEAAFDSAEPGTEWVIVGCRDTTVNLRSQLCRIIRRAGLNVWPKLWQNLRSTRETELAEAYPLHLVVKWLGNSQQVAAKHHLQVTDTHFEQAAAKPTGASQAGTKPDEATRQTTQQASEMAYEWSQGDSEQECKTPVFPGFANTCDCRHECLVGDTGLEPVTPSLSKQREDKRKSPRNPAFHGILPPLGTVANHCIDVHKFLSVGGNSAAKW